jgi:hypothetical protein
LEQHQKIETINNGLVLLYPHSKKKIIQNFGHSQGRIIYSQSNPSMKAFKLRLWAMSGATRNNTMDKWELWEKHTENLTIYASLNEGTNVRSTWELWEQHKEHLVKHIS